MFHEISIIFKKFDSKCIMVVLALNLLANCSLLNNARMESYINTIKGARDTR